MIFSARAGWLILALQFLRSFSSAATTTSAALAPASTSASIFPGNAEWTYYGCYNETTLSNGTNGLRALNGGIQETLDTMTVATCLAYCKSNGFSFAGLEYTRECYCANHLSAISAKLADSECNLACEGNSTQFCGGNLKLSVYQAKSATKGAGIKDVHAPLESILALGIAMGVLLCLA